MEFIKSATDAACPALRNRTNALTSPKTLAGDNGGKRAAHVCRERLLASSGTQQKYAAWRWSAVFVSARCTNTAVSVRKYVRTFYSGLHADTIPPQ